MYGAPARTRTGTRGLGGRSSILLSYGGMWSQFSRKSMRLYQSHGNAPIVALTQSCRHLR